MAANLKELSKQLGLSQTTVSRAINGYPEVSSKTRERVLEAAKAGGYKASQAARSLAGGKSHSIGFVLPASLSRSYEITLLPQLATEASKVGYHIVLIPAPDGTDVMPVILNARQYQVAGLIWPKIPPAAAANLCAVPGLPPILLVDSPTDVANAFSSVSIDHRGGAYHAASFLVQLGHHHLCHIGYASRDDFSELAIRGIQDVVQSRQSSVELEFNRVALTTSGNWANILADKIARTGRPSAIICDDTSLALRMLTAIAKKGLVAGRDVSIIAHDVVWRINSEVRDAAITRISTDASLLAKCIVERAIAIFLTESPDPIHTVLSPELVLGSSTGRRMFSPVT